MLWPAASRCHAAPVLVIITVVVVTAIVTMASAGLALRHRVEAAEQAVAFAIRTGGEVERAGTSRIAAIPKRQAPKAVNDHGPIVAGFEQSLELAVGLKAHDRAAAEIADQ